MVDDNQHLLPLQPFGDPAEEARVHIEGAMGDPAYWLGHYALLISQLARAERVGLVNVRPYLEHVRKVHSIIAAHCNGPKQQ